MHPLHYARRSKGMNDVAADFVARGVLDDEVSSLTALCPCFYAVINIAVGVAGENYGLFPAGDIGCDAFDKYGCTEDGAVEYAADGAVGRLPHLFEGVLLHTLRVGGYRSALYGDAQAPCRFSRRDGDGVVGGVPFGQTKVIVLRLQIDEGFYKYLFYPPPEDAGHFVAVHFDERRSHLYLFHDAILRYELLQLFY